MPNSTSTTTRRTSSRPRRGGVQRGERFWNVSSGSWRVYTGKGRQHVGLYSAEGEQITGGTRSSFDGRAALRRAGLATRQGAGSAASSYRRAGRVLSQRTGFEQLGVGSFLIYAALSLLGLAILRASLGGRGPAGVDRIFALAGGGLSKLISPTDPIIGHGAPAPYTAPRNAAGAVVTTSGADTPGPHNVPAGTGATNLVTVPGQYAQRGGIQIASGVLATVVAIAKRFGVKVSSGYRSPAHNAEVGGAQNSDHLTGTAADFVGSPAAMAALHAWATSVARARGWYVEPMAQAKNHVHISFNR